MCMMGHLRTRVWAPLVSFFYFIFYFNFFWPRCAACGILVPWPRTRTRALASESLESQPLDRQGIPLVSFFLSQTGGQDRRKDIKKNKEIRKSLTWLPLGWGEGEHWWSGGLPGSQSYHLSCARLCPCVPLLGTQERETKWSQAKQVLPRFELGSLDSKSRELTITP